MMARTGYQMLIFRKVVLVITLISITFIITFRPEGPSFITLSLNNHDDSKDHGTIAEVKSSTVNAEGKQQQQQQQQQQQTSHGLDYDQQWSESNGEVGCKQGQKEEATDMGADTADTEDTTKEAFNRTNPHIDSWCPNAKCFNSPMCTPCNRRFLFIVTTGRSGSTTLLKMFNLLPNVRRSGENYGELFLASQLTQALEKDKMNFYDPEVIKKEGSLFMHEAVKEGAFMHNAMPIGSMACVMQTLVNALNPPDLTPETLKQFPFDADKESKQILGIKTIRLQKSLWTPWQANRYFMENFPCARFIINIRSDIDGLAQSVINTFKRDDLDEAVEDYKAQTKFLKKLAELMDGRAKLIDMDVWKNDVSVLNDVLDWLGFENCSFKKILHENINGYQHDSSEISIGENCIYPHI